MIVILILLIVVNAHGQLPQSSDDNSTVVTTVVNDHGQLLQNNDTITPLQDENVMPVLKKAEEEEVEVDLGAKVAKAIAGKVLPGVGEMLLDKIKPLIFGVPPRATNLGDVAKLLRSMDGTLEDIKEILEYKKAFNTDDKYSHQMKHLNSTYDTYHSNPEYIINQEQIVKACKETDTTKIIDFYDKELNEQGVRTIGDYLFKSWTISQIKQLSKLYYLKINQAALLYSICTYILNANKPDVNETIFSESGYVKKANRYVQTLQDKIEVKLKEVENGFFAKAKKDIEDLDLFNSDNSAEHISDKYNDLLTKKYDHVDWTVMVVVNRPSLLSNEDRRCGFYHSVFDYKWAYAWGGDAGYSKWCMYGRLMKVYIGASPKFPGDYITKYYISNVKERFDECMKDQQFSCEYYGYTRGIVNRMEQCSDVSPPKFAGAMIAYDGMDIKGHGPGISKRCYLDGANHEMCYTIATSPGVIIGSK